MEERASKPSNEGPADLVPTGLERMKLYCQSNPGTPSALQRPHLFVRDQLWIVLLGPNAETGIVGIGPTVEEALRDFDTEYLASLHPPEEPATETETTILAMQ